MSQFATDRAILVTGAAGLIGNVVRHQLEAEGAAVIPIDRVGRTEEGSEIVVCDVNDIHGLHALAAKNRIAGIVHCGALSGPILPRRNDASPCFRTSLQALGRGRLKTGPESEVL
jgi:UDP-glucuronate 4-epimerase